MKKLKLFIPVLLLFLLYSTIACAQTPVISTFSPVSAGAGSSVTITGQNFSADKNNNIVWFGKARATVSSASATQLIVQVPQTSDYGPISLLNLSSGLKAVSAQFFDATFKIKNKMTASNFEQNSNINTTDPYVRVDYGDIDGDGKTDLVRVNADKNTISISLNIGTGGQLNTSSFAPEVILPCQNEPTLILVADMDNDGKNDIIVGSSYGLTIFINTYTQGTTLNSASFQRVDLPFTADKIAVSDLDGDGKPDLAIAHNADQQLILLKNNMAGGKFDASSLIQAAVLPFDGSELHIADMDGDGKPDIFYPSGDGILFLHNNVGSAGITTQAFNGNMLDLPQGAGIIVIADLDGDSKPDLVFTGNNNLYSYKNISQPGSLDNSSFQSQGQVATGAQPFAIATGDFDGDGKPDVAVIDNGDRILSIFHNIYNAAAPTGAWLERIKYALPISPYTLKVADLNGDGYPDLVITKSNKAGILLIKNEPADIPVINSFSPAMAAAGSTVTIKGKNFTENPSNVNVYFGDRRAKIISLTDSVVKAAVPDGTSYARISLLVKPAKRTAISAQTFRGTYLNKANITNSDFKLSLQINLGQYMQDIRFADFDGDGFPDLIYIDNTSKQITIQKNRGQQVPIDCGLFTTVYNFPNTIVASSFLLCDVNGDGRQDIVVTSENETGYYLNTSAGGTISFSAYKQLFTSTVILDNSVLSTEDLDRDGRPDFTSNLQIYRNTLTENDQSPGVNDPFEPNSDVYPVIVTFADADGDGKADMFSYEGGSAGMSVRQNVSSPGYLDGFSFGQVQATGIPSQLLRMKDLDNDGKLDAISNDKLFKNISSGPGNFAYTQEGAFPEADFLQDVNGDGLADYGNSSGPYLTNQHRLFIHQNRAAAGQMPVYTDEITLGYDNQDPALEDYNPEFVAIEDLNNDNKPEMVYYDPEKYQLFFFENVSQAADNDPAPQITSVSPQAGQIDSKVSISGKNFAPVAGNNYVYFGGVQGRVISGSNTMLNVQVPPGALTAPVNVINSITKLNALSDQPYKLIHGAGLPQPFTANSFKALGDLADNVPGSEFRLADLNNDGKYELVVLGSGQLTIYNSTGTDAYGNPAGFVKALSYAASDAFRLSIADLNGDNRPEILVMTGSNVTVFENNSNSECGLSFLPQPATPTGGNFTVGDIDGDGKPDIIVGSENGIDGYLNTSKRGSISFGPYQSFHIAAVNNQDASRAIYLVDFDGDGKKDIIYMLSNGNDQLVLIRNLGGPAGSLPAFAAPVFINTGYAYGLAVSDVDGDGKPDIVLTTVEPNAVQVYRNVAVPGSISAASLAPPLNLALAAEYNSIAMADFDGDGKPDILLGDSYDPSIGLLHNTAKPGTIDKASFEDPVTYAIGENDNAVCLDLNKDGRTDILLHMGSSFKFLQNDSGNPGLELFINSDPKHYIVHAPAVFVDSLFKVDNSTGRPITSATVSISENYDPDKDMLAFNAGNAPDGNITASFSGPDGTLTLSSAGATASTAQWQQALQSVMFSSSTADTSARLITTTMYAGAISSLPVNRLFTLQIVPQPNVISFTPAQAPAGATVTINGSGFTAVTGVSFGGTPASSFTVNSATSITAVVAAGSSGIVSVSNPVGSSSKDGFTFIDKPVITPGGPVELKTGESVVLQTPAISGLSYQWSKDGVNITGATGTSYTVTDAGSYTVSILYSKGLSVISDPVTVSVIFTLPPDNFLLSSTSATCRGVSDGSVTVTAKQSMSYVLTLTGAATNTYPFTTVEQVNGLAPGNYQACITVPGQPGFQQCFSLVIGQPAELSVYTTVNNIEKTVTLNMSGSNQYTIHLNNSTYVSTQDTLSLPLSAGNNEVSVSTDKSCQGEFVKNIILNAAIAPYPNPVSGTLTVDMGEDESAVAKVTIINRSGKEIYSSQLAVQSKKLYVDFSNLVQGLYVLSVKTASSTSVYKILKE